MYNSLPYETTVKKRDACSKEFSLKHSSWGDMVAPSAAEPVHHEENPKYTKGRSMRLWLWEILMLLVVRSLCAT